MKPTDNLTNKPVNNPYHVSQIPSGSGSTDAIDDLVKLELTAEQMLGEEVDLAKAYVREDAQGFWGDMKLGLTELEVMTGGSITGGKMRSRNSAIDSARRCPFAGNIPAVSLLSSRSPA